MPGVLSELQSDIIRKGRIDAADVLAMRRIIYPDGTISLPEADLLFDLNDAVAAQSPEWHQLFVEALTDYTVYQAEPRGYVTPENVQWLIGHIARDGHVKSETELELLVNVLEKAISAPDPLAVYALNEVKAQVLRSNRIAEREVALLRRVLYAAGGQQGVAITREEAEVIYAIHDAHQGQDDDPAWIDLFTKVLLNHLMFASGFAPPSREEALRRAEWLDDTSVRPGRFMANMVKSLRDVVKTYTAPDFQEEYLARRTAIQQEAESITDEEARWLASRLVGNGVYSAAERALIEALKAEQPQLHPLIAEAVAKIS